MDSDSQLGQLDFQGVAFTATVDADGTLGKVGGLWDKLGKDTMDLARRGLLHTVVVAGEQDDVPEEYMGPDGPIHVIRAETIDDAINQLSAHSLPRRAVQQHERNLCEYLDVWGNFAAIDGGLYQQLPLLQKIEPKQLAPPPGVAELERDPRRDQPTERQMDLESWLAGFAGIPRLVVTGAPGSGKSTLAQHLAWRVATNELQPGGRPLLPLRVSLKDWAAAVEIGKPLPTLPEYLARSYDECTNAPTDDDFNRWLHRGNVLLLLDGLDEAQGEKFSKTLRKALTQYKHCPTVLTCRTLHYEQYQHTTAGFDVFKLTPLSTDQQDDYIRAYAEVFPGLPAEALIDRLNEPNNKMRTLAGTPLLLSAICYVLADAPADALPETRGELFDRLVTKLLTRQRRDIPYPGTGTAPDLDTKRKVLECVALHGFLRDEGRFTFEGAWIGDRIKDTLNASGYDTDLAQWSSALRKDMVNVGLLHGKEGAREDFRFLHSAIQEFLTAGALARMINDLPDGWNASLEIAGHSYSITEIIDHKAWDPAWHEVVLLLAGRLNDPTPLLNRLSEKNPTETNPHGDDDFRHRLALSAECLPQIPEGRRLRQLTDEITTELFSLWWYHRRRFTTEAVDHLTDAIRALVLVNGRTDGQLVLDKLIAATRDESFDIVSAAASAIEALGSAAMGPAGARDDILDGLLVVLHDGYYPNKVNALFSLFHLGSAAARDDILDAVLAFLSDRTFPGLMAAFMCVGGMGGAAARDDILDCLFMYLHDGDDSIRVWAVRAIKRMGISAARSDIVDRISALYLYPFDGETRSGSMREELFDLFRIPGWPLPSGGSDRILRMLALLDMARIEQCDGPLKKLLSFHRSNSRPYDMRIYELAALPQSQPT